MADAVAGYRVLASELVTRWSDLASGVAAKIDSDQYDAKAATKAWADTATLSAETGLLLWFEALDALSILTGSQYDRYLVESDDFESPVPGATLELEGPLRRAGMVGILPAEADPQKLPDGQTTFKLRADATYHQGGTYVGRVLASTTGQAPQPVDVWITVA
jgi:hypothetical protein